MGKQEILPKRLDYLEANTPSCRFRINVDVINECFGANSSLYMKASYPSDNSHNFRELNSEIRLFAWLPKLFSNSSEWKNSISADEEFIYEDAENSRTQDWIPTGKHPLDHYRLVFVKATLKDDYVFKGIYKSERMENLHHVYKRVATKAKLIGNPVHTIEIIYDNFCFTKRDEQNRSTLILNNEKIGRVHFRKNDVWLNPYDYSLINIDEVEKLGLRVEKNPNSKDYPVKIYINSTDETTVANILSQVFYHINQEAAAIEPQKQSENELLLAESIENDMDKMGIEGLDRITLTKARVNQSKFRKNLLRKYHKCCLCEVSSPDLLIASHIKPWSDCEPSERLLSENGLLLCPNHDKLFDSGLISFDENGFIMISDNLSDSDCIAMGLSIQRINLTEKMSEFMAYHRSMFGFDN